MKIFAHDGKIINLEDVSNITKNNRSFNKYYLHFKFISKGSDHLCNLITSDVSNEVADAWLAEIAQTMRG